MARNAPGAIRAPHPGRAAGKIRLIDGMSSRANAEIRQLERRRPDLGSIAGALAGYRREIRRPGRWMRLSTDDCPCPGCDVGHQRDVLEAALRALPPPAGRELRRIVTVLDGEFLRKTLPDPHAAAASPWRAEAWWRQRVEDR